MSTGKRVWMFTGSKGSGKSTAVARYARPSEIHQMCVFDTEDSMSDILANNERLGVQFGAYIRAYDRLAMTAKEREQMLDRISSGKLPWVDGKKLAVLAEYWQWFTKKLASTLKQGQFKYLVIDTTEPVEAAAAAWCEANKSKSGWPSGGKGWGKAEVHAVRPLIENTMEAIHMRGVTDILITSHIKNPWVEYAPGKARPVLDKVKPGGRLKIWSRITTGMFWMVRPGSPPNATGAPSAIVLKARKGKAEINSAHDEWEIQSLIPPRIPLFTWQQWRQYEQKGWNPLNPKPGELLTAQEQKMISELLTEEQMKLMIVGAAMQVEDVRNHTHGLLDKESLLEARSAADLVSTVINKAVIKQVKGLAEEGLSRLRIAKQTSLTAKQVAEILEEQA